MEISRPPDLLKLNGAALCRGIRWLEEQQGDDGRWQDPYFNAPGFPRVFYLTYHGYRLYFPLWALARYRRLGPGACR